MKRKFLPDAVVPDRTLNSRQIRVIASDATPDRDGDIMDPAGCDLTAYRRNPIVLAGHDRFRPIGTAKVARTPSAVEAVITFALPGVSATADEYCGLAKSGVVSAVSIGFSPLDAQPRSDGRGYLFKAWELLELSLVAVGSNPNAVVLERSFAKDGRVLAGVHADALMRAHRRIGAARQDVADVLKAAGCLPDDGDDFADPDDAPDQELAFEVARRKRAWLRGRGLSDRDRRKRMIAVAAARLGPAEAAAIARSRLIERMRRGA
jgi:HK97 family phage prohead protease